MQFDLARDDGAEPEQGGEIEHVGSDHDAGADTGVMPGERRHAGGDLGCVGRQCGEHAQQRLGQARIALRSAQAG